MGKGVAERADCLNDILDGRARIEGYYGFEQIDDTEVIRTLQAASAAH
jgi:hypothetical protein